MNDICNPDALERLPPPDIGQTECHDALKCLSCKARDKTGLYMVGQIITRGELTPSVLTVYTVYMNGDFNWKFVLSQTDERAMYQQIVDHIHQHVILGDLAEGSKLPSMRELASMLKVSLITIKRAYLELERAGTIVTQHGKGSWVAGDLDLGRLRQEELETQVKFVAELATEMKISAVELTAMIEKHLKD